MSSSVSRRRAARTNRIRRPTVEPVAVPFAPVVDTEEEPDAGVAVVAMMDEPEVPPPAAADLTEGFDAE